VEEDVKQEAQEKEQENTLKPNFGSDQKQEKMIQKYFIEEDREKGRKIKENFLALLKYTFGPIGFLLILVICIVNSFADYFCLNKLYYFIEHFETQKKHLWDNLGLLYLYFLSPVFLVIIRTSIISYCSIQASRDVHHDMMFSSLFGDLLGFHDRVETARLINRFSTDTDKMDKEVLYKISTFMLYTGFLISDVIIGMLTIGWWIVFLYMAYYVLVFYYQNLYVRFKKDLYRLEAVSRTPIVNLTNEMLDGKMIFKTLKKDEHCLDELCELLEDNTKNLTTQNALTNWFSIRISLFNVLIIQTVCFVFIWFALKSNYITVQKVVIFLPFCLNFIWNIDFWINLLSQLETMLVSLERCIAFKNIPSEKGYKNLAELKRRTINTEISKKEIQEFIRPFLVDQNTPSRTTSLSTGLEEPLIMTGNISSLILIICNT
jgi:ABC-type multidrug transport system fused ATPase/permease subunit